MAIQTIERSGFDPGSEIGSGLGNILSQGLQGLAQSKMQQLQRQHEYRSNLAGLQALGVPNAEGLAHFNPKQIDTILKQHQSSNDWSRRLNEYLGGSQQQPQQQMQPQEQQSMQSIQPQQPGMQQPQQTPQVTPEQQAKREEMRRYVDFVGEPKTFADREALYNKLQEIETGKKHISEAQQKTINANNKKFIEEKDKFLANADRRKKLAEDALALLKKGAVISGPLGLLPEGLLSSLSPNTGEFVTKIAELANETALAFPGVTSKAKIDAANRTKAKLLNPKGTQENILKDVIKETNDALLFDQAFKEVMKKNNNIQPENLKEQVRDRYKELEKEARITENESKKANQTTFKDLPAASELPGKKIKYPDGSIRLSDGKKWLKATDYKGQSLTTPDGSKFKSDGTNWTKEQ